MSWMSLYSSPELQQKVSTTFLCSVVAFFINVRRRMSHYRWSWPIVNSHNSRWMTSKPLQILITSQVITHIFLTRICHQPSTRKYPAHERLIRSLNKLTIEKPEQNSLAVTDATEALLNLQKSISEILHDQLYHFSPAIGGAFCNSLPATAQCIGTCFMVQSLLTPLFKWFIRCQ